MIYAMLNVQFKLASLQLNNVLIYRYVKKWRSYPVKSHYNTCTIRRRWNEDENETKIMCYKKCIKKEFDITCLSRKVTQIWYDSVRIYVSSEPDKHSISII